VAACFYLTRQPIARAARRRYIHLWSRLADERWHAAPQRV